VSPLNIAQYLAETRCLVVEPSAPFLQNITACLVSLGAQKANIQYAMRIEDALPQVDQFRPKLVILEYQIGERFGLEIVEKVDRLVGEQNRVVIFATRNGSDSAVAEAAEEQIDAYILKPFSMGDFKVKLEETILKKMQPSNYLQKIRAGKNAIDKGDLDQALKEFADAKTLNSKPSLAFYYSGSIFEMKKQPDLAVMDYKKGLRITPLHYKCLMGEFDALYNEKKFQEAQSLVDDIRKNYPVSPQRFGKILVTAVYSKSLGDLPSLYKIFQAYSNRPPELVKMTIATLKLAARVMLKDGQLEKAVEYFDMGCMASHLSWDYMNDAIRELLKAGAIVGADEIYKKTPRQYHTREDYQILGFYIRTKMGGAHQELFESGRKLMATLSKGEPEFYKILIELSMLAGKRLMAEDIINRAVTEFPDLRQELYAIIE
jgi:CheY-like chemotaxis protein